MGKENSKKNQRTPETLYRFGEFELSPGERLLTRDGRPLRLAPEAFDALLCLVQNAEHLVTKRDLMDTLWPSTYVSEANLTNTLVTLRKVLGPEGFGLSPNTDIDLFCPSEGSREWRRKCMKSSRERRN
jgi:DNA-binding response OmpR family regulator